MSDLTQSLMIKALQRQNTGRPPVWFMRQAGRYHAHYQELKKRYSFMDICTRPEVAAEATMGPMQDFGFDSAILFSDLLFPLQAMGMGLSYPDKGPQLEWHLREMQDLQRLTHGSVEQVAFQGKALEQIRNRLSTDKTLLGFVGAPFTLFCYAVEGSHTGNLISSRLGLEDGRFEGFFEKLQDLLVANMVLQARSGADAIAVMDTCAGELDPATYGEKVVPSLHKVLVEFRKQCPYTPIIYYSKGTGSDHWRHLIELPIAGIGIDWKQDLPRVLREWGDRWAIQGNVDPTWLFLPPSVLEKRLSRVFQSVLDLPASSRQGWICGLGHGVLPKTPEENVKLFLKLQNRFFAPSCEGGK